VESNNSRHKLGFIQPFGLSSPGGGPKILRSLAESAPIEAVSIVTSPAPPVPTVILPELHLPARPCFGRLERTRFNVKLAALGSLYAPRFRDGLKSLIATYEVTALHIVAHSAECMEAIRVARETGLPYYLSVHDDLEYTMVGQPHRDQTISQMPGAWKDAVHRFVISREMGEEYCKRYTRVAYDVVTDGVDHIAALPRQRDPHRLRVYFMGLFHNSYAPNLQCLMDAMEVLGRLRPDAELSLTLRCGVIPDTIKMPKQLSVTILPFASDEEIVQDMQTADLLYMPLQLGDKYRLFTQFSLSTKMISYLASGIPILYHGPLRSCAAGHLLESSGAAICVDSLDPRLLQLALSSSVDHCRNVAEAALRLATTQFRREDSRRRFWEAITGPWRKCHDSMARGGTAFADILPAS
jgi:hypothetical protein